MHSHKLPHSWSDQVLLWDANGPLLSPDLPSLPYTWAGKPSWPCTSPMSIPWHLWGNRRREQRVFQRTQGNPGTQQTWLELVFHRCGGHLSRSLFQLLLNLTEDGCGSHMLLLVLNMPTPKGAWLSSSGMCICIGDGIAHSLAVHPAARPVFSGGGTQKLLGLVSLKRLRRYGSWEGSWLPKQCSTSPSQDDCSGHLVQGMSSN